MPTDIFTEDPATERLASYFHELYDYLMEQGVPEECLPSPWHVLRRVVKAIDQELLREWLDAYASIEAEFNEDLDDLEEISRHHPEPKRRPSYLRALDSTPDEEDATESSP